MITRILLAVEPASLQATLRRRLKDPDILVETLPRRGQIWQQIGRRSADLLMISLSLVPDPTTEAIRTFLDLPDAPMVVVLTDNDDPEKQAMLTAAGAHAVLFTGVSEDALFFALQALLERRQDESPLTQNLVPRPEDPKLADFASRSPRMIAFMSTVTRVVSTNTTLLFVGETGVGKERLARAIHGESARGAGPFVSVNCGALPESLLESELFGHEEGAFTGATRPRRGWFEVAHRGTIFLDEIGEMPHHLQVKLLRVLQTREVQRVGGERALSVDVRIMAATNRDLEADVDTGRFRADLFYRLSVVTLEIPPLRTRPEDIAVLVERYIQHFAATFATDVHGIQPEALAALQRYRCPGNVRELVNIVERAMILCPERLIRPQDLPEAVRRGVGATGKSAEAPDDPAGSLDALLPADWSDRPLREVCDAVVEEVEKKYLIALLQTTRGRIGETARRAGINPRSVYNKMRRYGLEKMAFRPTPDRDGSRGNHPGPGPE